MNRNSRTTIYSLVAAVCLLVGVGWSVLERPAVIDVVSIGNEVDGFTPIQLDVSCGRFSRCVITCEINGRQTSRADSQDLTKATVYVLTGSKKYRQTGADPDILHTVAVGDSIVVETPAKKAMLFECIDDLNQRWAHSVHFLP